VGITPALSVILLVMLILEALVFGAFTGFMFGSQLWAVLTDETVRSDHLTFVKVLLLFYILHRSGYFCNNFSCCMYAIG
jgi:hypothetical protein